MSPQQAALYSLWTISALGLFTCGYQHIEMQLQNSDA